ncbi:MAG TPA: glucoamylase family protein, partial [Fimbriimonadaceae bacterium]|nr:glucoamylase family protein [Fimbriimonadaceae bacterium]
VSPRCLVCALLTIGLLLSALIFPLLTRLTNRWMIDPIILKEPAQNFARSLLFTAALPHQAWLSISAIGRVIYRRTVSHRLLLEWATGTNDASSKSKNRRRTLLRMAWAPLFAVIAVAIVMDAHPREPFVILPFAALWIVSPFILAWLDRPLHLVPARVLSPADRSGLRHTARLTWRFFDEFVGPKTHHLPPDNFQEMPRTELAERTSPTNIGLYLASVLAAHDLGYITADQAVQRILATMRTIDKLEHYRGHLLNWYDTSNLQPLGEKYVSSVDSGNLMGALWTVQQGLEEILHRPFIGHQLFHGLSDTLAAVAEHKPGGVAGSELASIARAIAGRPEHLNEIARQVRGLRSLAENLFSALSVSDRTSEKCLYWANQIRVQVGAFNDLLDRHYPWLDVLESPPESGMLSLGPGAHAARREALSESPSLWMLATGTVSGLTELISHYGKVESATPEVREWLGRLSAKAAEGRSASTETQGLAEYTMTLIADLDREMDMKFLYDRERRLFAIGFNVAEQRLDHSYYDLIASEARLSSFLAIARGEVPTEHWWALGRPFGFANLKRPLLSWSGTMFEYLMPLLFTKNHANSLLDQACRTAVDCQVAYARRRGIPWGISESAYSALDSRQVYQYRAFGVPVLALKRGLEEDIVVSPYSSALALAVDPRAAAKNLRRNGVLAQLGLRGEYGFYESIDFTRHYEPHGQRGIIVHTYMAHHQGMTLLAIDNAMNGDVMQERFHADARVRATASLLYERVPVAPPLVKSYTRETPTARLSPVVVIPAPGRVDTPDTPTPRTCLLSNSEYRVMVTNAGGGYSRWRDFDITRWRADTTTDDTGKFCYLRDVDSEFAWSVAFQPTAVHSTMYHAAFSAEKAEIRRRDRGIETIAEIVVSPEDPAEVWRLTLINRSSKPRRIELTTYAELALARHSADRTHPAFNKMFIETAMLRDL